MNLLDPVTLQVIHTDDDDDDGDQVFVHVVRASRCFKVDNLRASLCHKLRYPACLPMHFSALFPTATPAPLMQSITATPPLTSPGEETLPTSVCKS